MKNVTITDIAKMAGVANSTVTNALNPNSKKISQKRREEILKIVDEMGYRPNKFAQNLSMKNKKVIGFFMFSDSYESFSHSVINQKWIYHLNKVTNNHDIEFINFLTEDDENAYEYIIDHINKHHITDFIVHGLKNNVEMIIKIKSISLNKIFIELPFVNDTSTFVSCDNFNAQYELVSRVIEENNISNILYIPGDFEAYVSIERDRGVVSLLSKKNNLNIDKISGSFSPTAVIKEIEGMDLKKYDYIIAPSDFVLINLLGKKRHEFKDDIIISGFDGDSTIKYFDTTVYTVRQDIEDLATKSIEMLIKGELEVYLSSYTIESEHKKNNN